MVVEGTEQRTLVVQPGERLTVGRDPSAVVILSDPQVSFQHAVIERRGPGWLVRSLDPANPVWLLDPTGRAQPIEEELGLRSGELLIGGCQLMLYTPPSGV